MKYVETGELFSMMETLGYLNRRNRKDIEFLLTTMAAADVVPIQHGKWIFLHEFDFYVVVSCSNCHMEANEFSQYCPNCGARMDLN